MISNFSNRIEVLPNDTKFIIVEFNELYNYNNKYRSAETIFLATLTTRCY